MRKRRCRRGRGSIRPLVLLLRSQRRARRIRSPRNIRSEDSAGGLHLDLGGRRWLGLSRVGVVVRLVRLRRFGEARRRHSLRIRHPSDWRLSFVGDQRWLRRRSAPSPFSLLRLLLLPPRLLLLMLNLGDVLLLLLWRWRTSLLLRRRLMRTRRRGRQGVGLVEARIGLRIQVDLIV